MVSSWLVLPVHPPLSFPAFPSHRRVGVPLHHVDVGPADRVRNLLMQVRITSGRFVVPNPPRSGVRFSPALASLLRARACPLHPDQILSFPRADSFAHVVRQRCSPAGVPAGDDGFGLAASCGVHLCYLDRYPQLVASRPDPCHAFARSHDAYSRLRPAPDGELLLEPCPEPRQSLNLHREVAMAVERNPCVGDRNRAQLAQWSKPWCRRVRLVVASGVIAEGGHHDASSQRCGLEPLGALALPGYSRLVLCGHYRPLTVCKGRTCAVVSPAPSALALPSPTVLRQTLQVSTPRAASGCVVGSPGVSRVLARRARCGLGSRPRRGVRARGARALRSRSAALTVRVWLVPVELFLCSSVFGNHRLHFFSNLCVYRQHP